MLFIFYDGVMSASEFTLDINNPEEPKILCVGNNPDRQNIYGAALGLYNSRIVKLINKKGRLKSSVIIDELPTIYFKGLDNLIATARSNKVAVCLGFQDFSQLVRDYGDKEAKVVIYTVGNIFSGQVVGETAKTLSERFGKVLQKRQSISINRKTVPAGKYANQALASVGLYTGIEGDDGEYAPEIADKVALADKVGTAASYVSTGDCVAGFVYSSDIFRYDGIEEAFVCPEDSHKPIVYPGAVAESSEHADEAKAFIDFCLSNKKAQKIWAKYGFELSA